MSDSLRRGMPEVTLAVLRMPLPVVTARVPPLAPPCQRTEAFRIIRFIAIASTVAPESTNTLFLR